MPIPLHELSMLPWLGLAAAPIIIHLINKNRHRTIDWGAMRFLEISVVTSARRLRLQEIILLLIRTAIVALVVLAMARPYLPGVAASGDNASKRNMVILFDRSMSMAHGREALPRIARAKEAAEKLLNLLKEGDTASVVFVDHRAVPVTPEPTAGFKRLRAAIEEVSPTHGRADFARGFNEALRQLKLSSNPLREVYVITDGQAQGWHTSSKATWDPARRTIEKLHPKPDVFVLTIEPSDAPNIALTDVRLSRLAVGVFRPVKIDARVTNYSEEDRPQFNVRFLIDGEPEATLPVDIKAHSSATPSFEYHFKEPGSHYVTVELDEDSLALDDTRVFSVDVFKRLPVLIVDGDPSAGGFDSEVAFLALALAPKDSANPDFKDVVDPTTVQVDNLSDVDLEQYHVIVLANVSSVPARQVARIERFVQDGGGLLICPGNLCDMDRFNELLYRDGDGLSPVKLVKTEGDDRQTEEFNSVITAAFSHKALAPFADPKQGDLSRIHAYKWYQAESLPEDYRSTVLCRFEDGTPFLSEREFGRGGAMLMSVPVDDDWSNLPRRSFYLPLMHHIVYYLGSGVRPARNLPLGIPITHFVEDGINADQAQVIDPRGAKHTVELRRSGDRLAATFDATHRAGLYEVIVGDDADAVRTCYTVAPQTSESDLQPLSPESEKTIGKTLAASIVSDWDALYELIVSKSTGDREIWRWFVAAVLALLALEIYLTSRWSRVSATSATTDETT